MSAVVINVDPTVQVSVRPSDFSDDEVVKVVSKPQTSIKMFNLKSGTNYTTTVTSNFAGLTSEVAKEDATTCEQTKVLF